jgi:hypothetical protein
MHGRDFLEYTPLLDRYAGVAGERLAPSFEDVCERAELFYRGVNFTQRWLLLGGTLLHH